MYIYILHKDNENRKKKKTILIEGKLMGICWLECAAWDNAEGQAFCLHLTPEFQTQGMLGEMGKERLIILDLVRSKLQQQQHMGHGC
jgi:hypothetical protein